MASQPLHTPADSDIPSLIVSAIVRNLRVDQGTAWRIHYALGIAMSSKWTRFKQNNSMDIFYASSQDSRKTGACDAQYARVSHLPVNGKAITHYYSV